MSNSQISLSTTQSTPNSSSSPISHSTVNVISISSPSPPHHVAIAVNSSKKFATHLKSKSLSPIQTTPPIPIPPPIQTDSYVSEASCHTDSVPTIFSGKIILFFSNLTITISKSQIWIRFVTETPIHPPI